MRSTPVLLSLLIPLAACELPVARGGAGTGTDSSAVTDIAANAPVIQPNIVLFLVDDLGWQDLEVALGPSRTGFNERYQTPNVMKMARQGVRFTQAYASSPVCTPTRTSILRGQHPARTRITDWTLYNDRDFSREMETLADPPWQKAGLAPGEHLLTERLREAGYYTLHVGKAHFGALETDGADPLKLGFDVNIAGHAAGGPGSYFGQDNYGVGNPGPWGVPGLRKYHGTDTFLTHALTLEAEREIAVAAQSGKPFFLNFAHYAVHAPLHKDERFYQRYLDAGMDDREARYAALIEGYDHSLGRIWDRLKELEVADNTIILFYSDNGGLTAHARGEAPEGGTKDVHNAPLRSGKGSGYEGGIRVPFLACWAGDLNHGLSIPTGRACDSPILSTDFYISILELAGVKSQVIAAGDPDGQSFLPLLAGVEGLPQERALAWHYPHKWGPRGDRYEPFTALREGDWKILYWYETGDWELYNLDSDLGEHHNLMEARPGVAAQMQEALREWMIATDAQRPTDKQSGEMLALP